MVKRGSSKKVNQMNRRLAALSALAALPAWPASVPAAPGQTPPLAWVFRTRHDPQTDPHTDVFLRVGSKQILIMPQAEEEFHAVAKADYKDSSIPASALAACSGWWAGAGDKLYVIRRGRSLIVYRKELDEQAPDLPWKRLKVIALR